MTEVAIVIAGVCAFFIPGIYLGVQMAIAWTVFKALTKKR